MRSPTGPSGPTRRLPSDNASTAHALAQRVTDAHGGLDAWYEAPVHAVHFSSGGLAFAAKGEGRTLTNVRGTFATTSQRIALCAHTPVPWNYDVGNSEELAADVACLRLGRRRFRWAIQDIAAFASAAMWTYLNLPFILYEPGVELQSVNDGATFERLAVTLPARFTSHATRHVLHVDTGGHIRRHDSATTISRLVE